MKGKGENNFLGFKTPLRNTRLICWGNILNIFNVKVRGSARSQNVDAHASLQAIYFSPLTQQCPGDKQQEIDAIAMWVTQLGHSTWAPAQTDGTRARLKLGRLGAR